MNAVVDMLLTSGPLLNISGIILQYRFCRFRLSGSNFSIPCIFFFGKQKRRFEIQYFKTAVLRRKAEQNGLVVYASAECYQKERADKPCACWLRVIGSASVRLAL